MHVYVNQDNCKSATAPFLSYVLLSFHVSGPKQFVYFWVEDLVHRRWILGLTKSQKYLFSHEPAEHC